MSAVKIAKFSLKSLKSLKSPGYLSTPKFMSTLILEKEKGEEARFIRAEEQRRAAELKAKLDQILALDNNDQQKVDLVGIIEGKQEQSFLTSYGLGFLEDYKFAVPVAMCTFIPLLQKGYIILNEETYIVIGFMLLVATGVTQLGPIVTKEFDAVINKIREDLKAVDESLKEKIVVDITLTEELVGMDKVFGEIHELVDDLSTLQAQSLTGAAEHNYREVVAKKLDSLVALENAAVSSIKQRALADVKADVLNTFKTDKKIKEAALNQALAVLSAGSNAKYGKDIVGEAFSTSFKSYREKYSKAAPGSDKIIVQLEKDIALVLDAPVVDDKGGNVYITHPVSQRYVA